MNETGTWSSAESLLQKGGGGGGGGESYRGVGRRFAMGALQ